MSPDTGPNTLESWVDDGEWLTEWEPPANVIVGEGARQDSVRRAAGRDGSCLVPVNVRLEQEPDNPVDSNAIRASIGDDHVGYLRRELVEVVVEQVAAWRGPSSWLLAGVIRGGGEEYPSLGVHLWLDRRISSCPLVDLDCSAWRVSWPPFEEVMDLLATGEWEFVRGRARRTARGP